MNLIRAFAGALPGAVTGHPDFGPIAGYFDRMSDDVTAYTHYLEWSLKSGELDIDFAFPTTTFGGMIRLQIEDLFAEIPRKRTHLDETLARVREMPTTDPLFPTGITIAIDRGLDDVGFVFADYQPELGAEHLGNAFAVLGGGDTAALEPYVGRFVLNHAGLGWRNTQARTKAYVVGNLAEMVDAAGVKSADLAALARAVGSRRAHMVVDVVGGKAIRFGFELNFPRLRDDGGEYWAIVRESKLWSGPELTYPVQRVDGAQMMLSHLKVSFDPEIEWKAYFVFVRG